MHYCPVYDTIIVNFQLSIVNSGFARQTPVSLPAGDAPGGRFAQKFPRNLEDTMETIGMVRTACGLVQGVEMSGKYEGITMFRGIPFAKPPVGDLRW